jgi:hypothetical protein
LLAQQQIKQTPDSRQANCPLPFLIEFEPNRWGERPREPVFPEQSVTGLRLLRRSVAGQRDRIGPKKFQTKAAFMDCNT